MKLSRYITISEAFTDSNGDLKVVIFGTRKPILFSLNLEAFEKLKSENFEHFNTETLDFLISNEIIVDANEDELNVVHNRNRSAEKDFETLDVVIIPTDNCQFGCTYCGQKLNHVGKYTFNEERLTKTIRTILESRNYKKLRIGWFGGEPLLALDEMESLTRSFKDICAEYSLNYSSKIITNGYSLNETNASKLFDICECTLIQITLDGSSATHDQSRPLLSGKSSYSKILKNIKQLDKNINNFKLILRCNVNRFNYRKIDEFIDELNAHRILEKIDRIHFNPVHDWGNDAGRDSLSNEEFAKVEIEWLSKLIQFGYKPTLLPNRVEINCMVFKEDAFLIDNRGNIFNCTEAALVEKYYPPKMKTPMDASESPGYIIGDISNGPFNRSNSLTQFASAIPDSNYPCTTCELYPVCGSSCPKHWVEGNRACPSFKFNIRERLLLNYIASRPS